MVDKINTLVVRQDTTLADIANVFGKDAENLYAKRTDEGLVLYSKTHSSLGDKLRLTKGMDGTWMSRGGAKKELARATVNNLLKRDLTAELGKLDHGVGKLSGDSAASLKRQFLTNIEGRSVLGTQHEVSGKAVGGIFKAVQDLGKRLDELKVNQAVIPKPERLVVPETGTRQLEGKAFGPRNISAPPLEIGGKRFEPEELLGASANVVVRYREVGGEGRTLAVKMGLDVGGDEIKLEQGLKAIKEYQNAVALAKDNPSVSGFTDIVKLNDGRVALIGEIIPNGDYEGFAKDLKGVTGERGVPHEKLDSGQITPEQRDLILATLIKDAVTGLKAIHSGDRPSVHNDMKPQNLMIDGEGRGVVVDLGESAVNDEYRPTLNGYLNTPHYMSPETMTMMRTAERQQTGLETVLKENTQAVLGNALTSIFGDYEGAENDRDILLGKLRGDITTESKARTGMLSVGQSNDIWGLGTAIYEMAFGERFSIAYGGKGKMNAHYEGALTHLSENFDKAVGQRVDGEGVRSIGRSTGNDQLDDLLNKMLAFDPKDRATVDVILDHPMLQNPLVGSDEVRGLIVAVKTGTRDKDPGIIDEASSKLG